MSRKIFNDGNKYSSPAGAHSRMGSKGQARKPETAYYSKNRSPVGQLQAKQMHRRASKQFSQYDTSAIRPKKGPGGKIIGIIVAILVVLLVLFLLNNAFHIFGDNETKTDIVAGQSVEVTIDEGSSTTDIAQVLYDADVINNRNTFKDAVKSKDAASSLKPGTYQLTTLMDMDTLIDTLVEGPAFYGNKLTIPEGSTINETAAYVETATGIKQADFLALAKSADSYASTYTFLSGAYDNSLEGYLFPKTYDVPKDATADDVIRMMLDQFQTECQNAGISMSGANGMTLQQLVIIGSLIEKESQDPTELANISSVIYNRLNQNIALQIDATVVYALGDAYTGGTVTYDDLEVDSPYNTYKNTGLPPGPICSPSIESIEAAANPASTDYLYYLVTDDAGHHSFFATYDEFLAAKEAR